MLYLIRESGVEGGITLAILILSLVYTKSKESIEKKLPIQFYYIGSWGAMIINLSQNTLRFCCGRTCWSFLKGEGDTEGFLLPILTLNYIIWFIHYVQSSICDKMIVLLVFSSRESSCYILIEQS